MHLLILFIFFLFSNILYANQPCSTVNYEEDIAFNQIFNQKDPLVKETYQVFKRIKQVADIPTKYIKTINLDIYEMEGENREPFLIYPNGVIRIRYSALLELYKDSIEQGNIRLAFIIGHELAHLAHDDYYDVKNHCQLNPEEEKHADSTGFIYAAMAGFAVESLINDNEFHTLWLDWSNRDQVNNRIHALIDLFKNLQQQVILYEYGLRLAAFGQYEDGFLFMEEILKESDFRGQTLLNNLGYFLIQETISQEMSSSLQCRYWLPQVLDNQIILTKHKYQGLETDIGITDYGKKRLQLAIQYLTEALAKYPNYLPAYINLASSYFYLEEYHETLNIVERSLKHRQKSNAELKNLESLSNYYYNKSKNIDSFDTIYGWLKSYAMTMDNQAADIATIYNIAQLLEQRGRSEAKIYWDQVYQHITEIPQRCQDLLCKEYKNKKLCKNTVTARKKRSQVTYPPVKPPFSIGSQYLENNIPKAERYSLALAYGFKQSNLMAKVYVKDGAELLVMDIYGNITMVVLKRHWLEKNYGNPDTLPLPEPLTKVKLAQGTLWRYSNIWAALLDENNQLQELWFKEGLN